MAEQQYAGRSGIVVIAGSPEEAARILADRSREARREQLRCADEQRCPSYLATVLGGPSAR